MVSATIKALPEFLVELDLSLGVIPNKEYIPTHFKGPLGENDDFVGCAVSYKENSDLCFCGLGNIPESSERSIALAHLLTNIHLIRKLIDRYDCALNEAVFSLIEIAQEGNKTAEKALNEIAAMREHPVK